MNPLNRDQYLELLADLHSLGLDPRDEALLAQAEGKFGPADRHAMELTAAAVHLCFASQAERSMPASVRQKLLGCAESWTPPRQAAPASAPLRLAGTPADAPARPAGRAARLGWLAAAAAMALAAVGWWQAIERGSSPAGPTWSPPARIVDARQSFLNEPDTVLASWGDFKHPTSGEPPEQQGIQGDVAWCERLQTGYLRFVGLKPNDPAREQYQLWIIDERGLSQRISGAIFNAAESGETIVKIEPRIRVRSAAAFAVTIEEPGGTWVSDMTRRVTLAAVPSRG